MSAVSNSIQRIIGLDIGAARIGVAVSDPIGITAQGIETIHSTGWKQDIVRISELMQLYETNRIVIGLPIKMDGTESAQAEFSRRFGERLCEAGAAVAYHDERLTTSTARKALIEGNTRREKRKQVIDKVAAVIILQSFLDAGGWKEAPRRIAYRRVNTGGNHMDQNMDYNDIIELTDEEGNTTVFEHLMTVEYEGEHYAIVVPTEPNDEIAEDEALILMLAKDEDGEDYYIDILDNEALADAVFQKYVEIIDSMDDADDDDEVIFADDAGEAED